MTARARKGPATAPRSRRRPDTLPGGLTITVVYSGRSPDVHVAGVKPSDVERVVRWLDALFERLEVPMPGPEIIPGGTGPTDVYEDEYAEQGQESGRRRRRLGFESP